MNNLQKPAKSKIWIIGTIWANIAIVGIFLGLFLQLSRAFIIQLFGGIAGTILLWLIMISGLFYAIRLGVKSVLKKSTVDPRDIIKISIGVAIVPVILQLGAILYLYFYFMAAWPEPIRWIELIFANVGFFLITYFWLKRLV